MLGAGVPLAPVMAFWIASPIMDPEMFILTAAGIGFNFALAKTFAQSALLARRRRKEPSADVFSSLVNGEWQGKPLTRMMIQVNFFLLIIAGNETTRNGLSGGIQALCENPASSITKSLNTTSYKKAFCNAK